MAMCKFCALFLLTLSLFHYTVSGEDLVHMCLYSGNYTPNDPYETNLKELLSYLADEAPTNGFTLASKGESENRTHGLALCRGDLSPTDCSNCVVHASNDMLTFCPYNKGAMIMYENCTVRYSNEDFFGQTVNHIMICLKSPKNVNVSEYLNSAMQFSQRIQEFLSKVAEEAVLNPKMYASGKSEIDEFNTAYGLAQCSRDLSQVDCQKCLNQSLAFLTLPDCGQENEGIRVYSEICRVRYELNPFLNDNPLPLPLPTPSTSDAISPQPPPIASSQCLDAGILVVIVLMSHLLSHEF